MSNTTMADESKALALAPLITPFAFTAFAYFSGISGFSLDRGLLTFIGLFLAVAVASIPVAYLYMFFIGYRFYRLLQKKNRVNFWTLTLGGVFVADIPMLLIWPFSGSAEAGGISFYTTFQLFSFVGLMVGLNFWCLLNGVYRRLFS